MDCYTYEALQKCVALILKTIGFDKTKNDCLQVLTDLVADFIWTLVRRTGEMAANCGRTQLQLTDLLYGCQLMGVRIAQLEEHLRIYPDSRGLLEVPKYPVQKKNQKESQILPKDPTDYEKMSTLSSSEESEPLSLRPPGDRESSDEIDLEPVVAPPLLAPLRKKREPRRHQLEMVRHPRQSADVPKRKRRRHKKSCHKRKAVLRNTPE